jgi:16S rRNA (guanine966-N2)-methyltransferase
MRVQLRIVAGLLRGRKVSCDVHPGVRPTPQMVREALFSILGNAIPDRPFIDIFAGSGVIGLEAISRGASKVTFIDRDLTLASTIEKYLRDFKVADRGTVFRTDSYRWVERWHAPPEPVNVYVSPPFADYHRRLDALEIMVSALKEKLAPGSVLVLQGESCDGFLHLLEQPPWDLRKYGRNLLAIWVKEPPDGGPKQESSDGEIL